MTNSARAKKTKGKNKRSDRRNASPAPSSQPEESHSGRWTKKYTEQPLDQDNSEPRKRGKQSKKLEAKNKAKGLQLADTEPDGYAVARKLSSSESEAHKGLVNLGNTCFFNSIIQVLGHTTPLLQKLEAASGLGSLWSALSDCLRALHSMEPLSGSKSHSVNPSHLFALVSKRWPMYKKMKQQDSHEFLRLFIEGLQKEEGSLSHESKEISRSNTLENIFGGLLNSHVQCLACGHTCIIKEPFMDLTLNLPNVKSKHEKGNCLILEDLLIEFFKKDGLNNESVLDCEQCSHTSSEPTSGSATVESNEMNEILHWFANLSILDASDNKSQKNQKKSLRKASKWNLIQKLPNILVLHLNLFVQSTFGYTKSFQSLSLEPTLDLSPFLAPDALLFSNKAIFQLFGVVEHSGGASMNSGHYTARIRGETHVASHAHHDDAHHPWLYFSDEHVSYANAPYSATKGRTPYMLFYQSLAHA